MADPAHIARMEALRNRHIPAVRKLVAARLTPVRQVVPLAMSTRLLADKDEWVSMIAGVYNTVGQTFSNYTAEQISQRIGVEDITKQTGYKAAYKAFVTSYADEQAPSYVDKVAASLTSHVQDAVDPTGSIDDETLALLFDGMEDTIGEMLTITASNLAPLATGNAAMLSQGIDLVKIWNAVDDRHTRETHAEADGQVVALSDPFEVGDSELMFPCDDSLGADIGELINCRCVVTYDVSASKRRLLRLDWPERMADIVLAHMR